MKNDTPSFGKSNNSPPSFFARIPTRAIWDCRRPSKKTKAVGLTSGDFHIFAILCSYANNQGFAYPNSKTIGDLIQQDRQNVSRALKKCEKLGYIEKVSKFRSHPKWRHVMGTVWRIIYDERLNQEELIDRMNKEDPAPVLEEDLPTVEINDAGNQEVEKGDIELVEGMKVAMNIATWYCRQVEALTGQFRIVNERSVDQALAVLQKGLTQDQVKVRATAIIEDHKRLRRLAPEHLGFLLF